MLSFTHPLFPAAFTLARTCSDAQRSQGVEMRGTKMRFVQRFCFIRHHKSLRI